MQKPYKLEYQRPGCLFAGPRIGDAPKVQAGLSFPVSSSSPPKCQGLRGSWIPWDCLKDWDCLMDSPHPTNSVRTSAPQPNPLYPQLDTLMCPQQSTLGAHWDSGPGLAHGLGALGKPQTSLLPQFPHLKNGDVSRAPSESHLPSGQQALWRMVRQVEPGSAGHMTPPELGPPPPHLGREEGGSR